MVISLSCVFVVYLYSPPHAKVICYCFKSTWNNNPKFFLLLLLNPFALLHALIMFLCPTKLCPFIFIKSQNRLFIYFKLSDNSTCVMHGFLAFEDLINDCKEVDSQINSLSDDVRRNVHICAFIICHLGHKKHFLS